MKLPARAVAIAALVAASACNRSSAITQDSPATPSGSRAGAAASTGPSASHEARDAPNDGREPELGVHVVIAGQDTDALSLVRTERLRAKAEGRVLVVYAGASWCEPCKRLKHAIETRSLDAKLPKTTLLVFDADRDTERLASAGYTFQFIPYVALPGADGHPTDTAEARAKGSESWRELLAKLEAWQTRGP